MNIYPIKQWSGNLSHILLDLSRVTGAFLLGIPVVAAGTGLRCQSTGGVVLKAKCPKSSKYPKKLISPGDHLKAKRLELGLTQLTVSRILGVDECTVTNWEKNGTSPMLHLIPKVNEFLGYAPTISEPKTLGEKLFHYRKSHGISQKELARQMGIDPTTLGKIERKIGRSFRCVQKKVDAFLRDH